VCLTDKSSSEEILMTDETATVNRQRGGVTDPAPQGDERTSLIGFLQRQRDLVDWKARDCSDDVLRSVSTPTGLTLHGIVRHLEHVERYWFQEIFAGRSDVEYVWTDEDPDAELHVAQDISMESLLSDYAEETDRCDEIIQGAASLDEISATRGASLRWIMLHMIEETARHVGHMDLLREQADGSVGEDPEEDAPAK
jgi:hypothetical protein